MVSIYSIWNKTIVAYLKTLSQSFPYILKETTRNVSQNYGLSGRGSYFLYTVQVATATPDCWFLKMFRTDTKNGEHSLVACLM